MNTVVNRRTVRIHTKLADAIGLEPGLHRFKFGDSPTRKQYVMPDGWVLLAAGNKLANDETYSEDKNDPISPDTDTLSTIIEIDSAAQIPDAGEVLIMDRDNNGSLFKFSSPHYGFASRVYRYHAPFLDPKEFNNYPSTTTGSLVPNGISDIQFTSRYHTLINKVIVGGNGSSFKWYPGDAANPLPTPLCLWMRSPP